jgi:hypothetical protein
MQRYRKMTDSLVGMATDSNGDWVRYEDAAARIAELEQQLAKANDNLYYALELAIAHAPAKADFEWAAGLIERMDQPAPTKEEERDGEDIYLPAMSC